MNASSTWSRDEWIKHVEHLLVETFTLYADCMKTKTGRARLSQHEHPVLNPKFVEVLTHPSEQFNRKTALDAAVRRGRTQGELLEHGLSDGEARVFWWSVKKAAAGVVGV